MSGIYSAEEEDWHASGHKEEGHWHASMHDAAAARLKLCTLTD